MVKEDDKSNVKPIEDYHYYLFHQDFTPETTAAVIKFILERNLMKSPPKLLKIIINSYGGDTASTFALVDIIKGSKVPICTYGLGIIASSGLITFMAGTKGKRIITPNTSILSHQFTWGSFGKAHELMATTKEFNNITERMINHYKKCTDLDEKQIKKYLLPPEDVWLTAKEAVKYGIADEICEYY